MFLKLNLACSIEEKEKGQSHKVFEPSFDAKAVLSNSFLLQKFDDIHYHPVSGKWNLVDYFVVYVHSSVCFYENNLAHDKVKIKHYLDLVD